MLFSFFDCIATSQFYDEAQGIIGRHCTDGLCRKGMSMSAVGDAVAML